MNATNSIALWTQQHYTLFATLNISVSTVHSATTSILSASTMFAVVPPFSKQPSPAAVSARLEDRLVQVLSRSLSVSLLLVLLVVLWVGGSIILPTAMASSRSASSKASLSPLALLLALLAVSGLRLFLNGSADTSEASDTWRLPILCTGRLSVFDVPVVAAVAPVVLEVLVVEAVLALLSVNGSATVLAASAFPSGTTMGRSLPLRPMLPRTSLFTTLTLPALVTAAPFGPLPLPPMAVSSWACSIWLSERSRLLLLCAGLLKVELAVPTLAGLLSFVVSPATSACMVREAAAAAAAAALCLPRLPAGWAPG
eukprot:Colp12_sorted_trinity150504_noHs@9460